MRWFLLIGCVVGLLATTRQPLEAAESSQEQPPAAKPEEELDVHPRVALHLQDKDHPYPRAVDPENVLGATMRFGLIMTMVKDPRDPTRYKRLTYHERGLTNNTIVRVDNDDLIFGQSPGVWVDARLALPKDSSGGEPDGCKSIWKPGRESKIVVTQVVEVVRGQSNLLDTCLIRYVLENRDTVAHDVGLRFMLDTFVGAQDGVPFTIPGMKGLVDTTYDFKTAADVPDFIQALEHADLSDPGTVALIRFRVGEGIEPPSRVTLGAWPDPKIGEALHGARAADNPNNLYRQFMTMWDVPLGSMQKMKEIDPKNSADSCVVTYWPAVELKPGARRTVGFSYGVGVVAQSEGKIALSAGGSFEPGAEVSIVAQVSKAAPGQKVTVRLPEGVKLVEGTATQLVPPLAETSTRPISIVTWKVKCETAGTHAITVESRESKATIKFRIQRRTFDP